MPITTEEYMHYEANKHTKTDSLDAILDHIQKNPHTYMYKAISNERNDNKNIHCEHGVTNNLQSNSEKQRKYVLTQGWSMNI